MDIIKVDRVTKEFSLGQLHTLRRSLDSTLRRLQGREWEPQPPFKALDDVSFSIRQGEVVGVVGHNGAGKSTLLKLLSRISSPTSGRVQVSGKVSPLIEVGAGLVGDMTGRENIFLNAAILGMSRSEVARKFDEIVAFAEIEDFVDTPVKRYSSGMQAKLGFAVATAVESEILIVDEVLAVGDLAFQKKCFDRMEALIKHGGRTVLIVSHNLRQITRMCSRALLFSRGRLLMDGTSGEVCDAFFAQSNQKIAAQSRAAARIEAGEIVVVVGCWSSSSIVPLPLSVPGVALTMPLSSMLKLSLPSKVVSPLMVTGMVRLGSPAGIVRLPEAIAT